MGLMFDAEKQRSRTVGQVRGKSLEKRVEVAAAAAGAAENNYVRMRNEGSD